MRAGLLNGDNELVNYEEREVTIDFNVDGDFEVTFYLKDEGASALATLSQGVGITALACNPPGLGTATAPLDQNVLACMVMTTDTSGWVVTDITAMSATASVGGVTFTQDILVGNQFNKAISGGGEATVEWYFDAAFTPGSASTATAVTVSGTAEVATSRRRLGKGRDLEEQGEVEFVAQYEIEPTPDSSAYKMNLVGFTLGAAALFF